MRPMSYEIHLRGGPPASLVAELADATWTETGGETLLLTPRIDQEGLHRLVRVSGISESRSLELRQVTADGAGPTGRHVTGREPHEAAECYEVRLDGLLGPLLLATLPHTAASLESRNTLVLAPGEGGRELVDVLQLLLESGLEVESVREITPESPG